MIFYSEAKISPVGKVNIADIKKIGLYTLVFFAAPILMYLGQLQGILHQNNIVVLRDFIPNSVTIGAVEGWALGILINFLLKLSTKTK